MQAPENRLDSWKEIAAYLDRDERTVQRWEREKSLPVHRVPGGKRAGVFAFTPEIDAWLKQTQTEDVVAPPPEVPKPQDPAPSEPERVLRVPKPPRRICELVCLTIVTICAVGVAVAAYANHNLGRKSQMISRVTVRGSVIYALDDGNGEVWHYDLPEPVPSYGDTHDLSSNHLSHLLDINQDGDPEVVIGINPSSHYNGGPKGAVLAFTSSGKLLWRYEPQMSLRFGGVNFEPPWSVYDVFVSDPGGDSKVWVIFNHHLWWPSAVVRIDPRTGAGELWFLHSGHQYVVQALDLSGRSLLVSGGYNNEHKTSAVAIFSTSEKSSLPSVCEKYRPEDALGAGLQAYYVLPRSALNQVIDEMNGAWSFQRTPSGMEVQSAEVSQPDTTTRGNAIFHFRESDGTLIPTGFSFDDYHWRMHDRLQKEGKIRHNADQCPDRTTRKTVKMWTPAQGWTSVAISYVDMQ